MFVYILTNKNNTVLYVGVTNNLIKRVYEHKQQFVKGFTKKYQIEKLVYFEHCECEPIEAIKREKQLKKLYRKEKENLINQFNPTWKDLYDDLIK